MSLKAFHVFFISLSIVLLSGFAYGELKIFSAAGSTGALGWGSLSLGFAVLLVVYLGWFIKKSKQLPA